MSCESVSPVAVFWRKTGRCWRTAYFTFEMSEVLTQYLVVERMNAWEEESFSLAVLSPRREE